MQLQKLRIALKAYETNLLNESCEQILEAVKNGGIRAIGPIPLPTKRRIYCVLRSPHVDKDSREHFEIRIHKRLLEIYYDPEFPIVDLLSKIDLAPGTFFRIDLS